MDFPEVIGQLVLLDAAILVLHDLRVGIIQFLIIIVLADVGSLKLQPLVEALLVQTIARGVILAEDLVHLAVDLRLSPFVFSLEDTG